MDRRHFVGGVSLTSTLTPSYIFANTPLKDSGVLVEGAAFQDLGGWKLDTQDYQQMGGCHLLARGMGEPVAPAKTKASLPKAGAWHVWIRNRDWCPGTWQAPGRFKVHVSGVPLEPEFGADKEAWHWQDGGSVQIDAAGEVEVSLEDLTGFDGRCDAIYFNQDASPELPTADLVQLTVWKDALAGHADLDIAEHDFDVVIVGGGMTGCGAALAARTRLRR